MCKYFSIDDVAMVQATGLSAPVQHSMQLLACDLELPGDAPSSSAALTAESAEASSALPRLQLTDNRFIFTPPFEQTTSSAPARRQSSKGLARASARQQATPVRPQLKGSTVDATLQKGALTVLCTDRGRPPPGAAGFQKTPSTTSQRAALPGKRLMGPSPAAGTLTVAAKRRKPELLSASGLLSIAVGGQRRKPSQPEPASTTELAPGRNCPSAAQSYSAYALPRRELSEGCTARQAPAAQAVKRRTDGGGEQMPQPVLLATDIF